MKFKELKNLPIPDDAEVLVPSIDHEYRRATGIKDTALFAGGGVINEDFGEEMTPEAEYGKRKIVCLILH